jgi:hypothetical protein
MPRSSQNRQNALSHLGRYNQISLGVATFTSRTKHFVRTTGYGLELTWVGSYPTGGATAEAPYAGNVTVKVGVELSNGTILPVYFSGSRTGTILPGATLTSDVLGVVLNAGEFVWLRVYTVGATSAYHTRYCEWVTAGEGWETAVDKADSGTVAAAVGQSFAPLLATLQTDTVDNGVVCIGDSIMGASSDQYWANGFTERALSGIHPILNVGSSSEAFSDFQTNQSTRRRGLIAKAQGEYAILSFTNDVYNSRTLAQIQADILTTCSDLVKMGYKVGVCTLTPRTTSTDGWFTVANQTVTSPALDTVRRQVNDWLRTTANNSLFAVFDTAYQVEDLASPGKWKAPAGGNLWTGTITTTVVGVVNDSTKTAWTSGLLDGLTVWNSSTSAMASISRTLSTQLYVNTNNTYTVGNAYSVYAGLVASGGVHPSPEGHRLMSLAIDTNVFR